jgi:ABC-type bacteriocin/lantibiotic exporter with double-glycine peptidase domain
MNKILFRLGKERLEVNTERYRILMEAFGAFKIVKIHGAEKSYLNRFIPPAKNHAINQSYAQIISILPRFIIEGVAFSLLMLIILLVINNDTKFHEFMPIVALYTFAGYRLLPALQNFYFSLSQIRFSQKAFISLYKNIKKIKFLKSDYIKNKIPFSKSIKLVNVSYKYPETKECTFRKVNITIPALKTLAIIGPSGGGKTTILDILTGLLDPVEGFLMVDKKIINYKNKRQWQNNIGYVPQNIYLSDDTIESNIAFGIDKKNIVQKKIVKCCMDSNIHNFITGLPQGYKTKIGEHGVRLSGGQRQRIGIARALYNQPKILILDEATNSLDYLSEKILIDCIKNLKKKTTTILVTHRLNFIKKFDKIISLEKGKILKIK